MYLLGYLRSPLNCLNLVSNLTSGCQTDGQTHKQTDIHTHRRTYTQTDGQADKPIKHRSTPRTQINQIIDTGRTNLNAILTIIGYWRAKKTFTLICFESSHPPLPSVPTCLYIINFSLKIEIFLFFFLFSILVLKVNKIYNFKKM